jgi:hypothetical protein
MRSSGDFPVKQEGEVVRVPGFRENAAAAFAATRAEFEGGIKHRALVLVVSNFVMHEHLDPDRLLITLPGRSGPPQAPSSPERRKGAKTGKAKSGRAE